MHIEVEPPGSLASASDRVAESASRNTDKEELHRTAGAHIFDVVQGEQPNG